MASGERRDTSRHRKRVYIAGPYTKGDVALNVRTTIFAAQQILEAGHVPFVPHLYHFWHVIIPGAYEQWTRLDLAWIEVCDVLVRLPGDSDGADGEDLRARELGMSVYYSVADFLADYPLD